MEQDHPVLLTLLWTILANAFAYYKKFYSIPKSHLENKISLSLIPVLTCFGFYLALTLFIAPLLLKPFLVYIQQDQLTPSSKVLVTSLVQLITLSFVLLIVLTYLLSYSREKLKKIWKNSFTHSINYDFWLGGLTWFLSFPLVVVISYFFDVITTLIFGPKQYEQMAVSFVKMTIHSPLALSCALVSVILIAPIIEELLFRGLLQTYLKKYLNSKWAIILSACVFALFHLTHSQGVGNISLAISLFVLGVFLGFLYEKQASLFCSLGLHMAFNAISALRIIISPD